jgi:hypothetical protein
MLDSFLKRRPGEQGPAQLRNLGGLECPRGKFFEGAEGDAIGLAQGAVDGAGFGHAHLGVVEDEGGDVAGMRIAIADEAAALGRLVDGGLEDPEVLFGTTQFEGELHLDTGTTVLFRQPEQFSVSYVCLSSMHPCSRIWDNVVHVFSP